MILRNNFIFLFFISASLSNATDRQYRDCIILVDSYDWQENLGRQNCYLMSKLQAAIADQAVPILLNASLWNCFNERRLFVEQKLQVPDSRIKKVYDLYLAINTRIAYWSDHYNSMSSNAIQNKALIAGQINKEFYTSANKVTVTGFEYHLLLNYVTPFDPEEWCIYTNDGGYYLLIPKKYKTQYAQVGFRCDSLKKVVYAQDSAYIYFESQNSQTLAEALPDFFLTHDDFNNQIMPYTWNIVISGHGGGIYREKNDNGVVSWKGEPFIVNMTVQEFKDVLTFFQSRVDTHFLHYSCCYAGGNHSSLIFGQGGEKTYNFPIICGTLTDCISYCKLDIVLPSREKKYFTSADLIYDSEQQRWTMSLPTDHRWHDFFKAMATIDFSAGSIERLPNILPAITCSTIADIPNLCLPGTTDFFPLHPENVAILDDRLIEAAEGEGEQSAIVFSGPNILLIESIVVEPTIILESDAEYRFISIKSGDALHCFKKLKAKSYFDLPSAFWQAEEQFFDKKFLLDECVLPCSRDSSIFQGLLADVNTKESVLKNVFISQKGRTILRMFFTLNDNAVMIVAHKPNEKNRAVTIQTITTLSAPAKALYEEYYAAMRQKALV